MVPLYKVAKTIKNIKANNPDWTIIFGERPDLAGVIVCKGPDDTDEVARSEQLGVTFDSAKVLPFVYQVLEGTNPDEADKVMRPLIDLFA